MGQLNCIGCGKPGCDGKAGCSWFDAKATPLEKGTCACGGDNPFKHHTEKTCWSDDLGVAHAPQPEGIDEVTERIVIEYANLSGRESANRAEFRKRTRAHLMTMVKEFQNNVANNMEVGSDDWESFKEELRAEGAALERRRLEEACEKIEPSTSTDKPWDTSFNNGVRHAKNAFIALLRTSN